MRYEDVHDIACAIELTEESVFVISDTPPPVGTVFDLRLSFPHVIAPTAVRSSCYQVRIGSGPGTPSGFVARFDDADEAQRTGVRRIVKRLAAPALAGNPTRDVRVLLVEDNRLVSDMFDYALAKYFGSRGSRVTLEQAMDVPSAWSKLRAGHFDIVIVDYFLPDEDGAILIERLRRDPALSGTSVVAISIGGNDVRRATLSAGADLFLHKPIILKDLFQTLEFLSHEGATDAGAA